MSLKQILATKLESKINLDASRRWAPSAVDRWYDWDKGIWDGNSLGSCVDCAAEAAPRWDAAMITCIILYI
jgi:hypothetical protein